jgi:hypothetical protein
VSACEDGRTLTQANAKMWRIRVSNGEFRRDGAGPFVVQEPSETSFTMRPGHVYTFNVGIWVQSDREVSGVGGARAQALLEGNVLVMSIER